MTRAAHLAVLLLAIVGPGGADAESTARVERRIAAMGTEFSVVVDAATRSDALDASERVFEAVRSAESRLSTWDPHSELSRLNSSPTGEAVRVSPSLARDLAGAKRCSDETGGAFSAGMGALVEAWGLRVGGRPAEEQTIRALLPGIDASRLVVTNDRVTRLDDRFIVEEGGFGKGVGLDDAAEILRETSTTNAVLDLGGQVLVWGGARIAVDIADPRHRDRTVLRLDVSDGSVATTGNSERGIVVAGERLGHLLSPEDGRPVPDFGSVTVWAGSAARADCLSTALYVMGPERALAWSAGHPDVGVVVVEVRDGHLEASASANLRDRIAPISDAVELRFQ